jgi:hypothetical protein
MIGEASIARTLVERSPCPCNADQGKMSTGRQWEGRMEELVAHLEMVFRHYGAAYEPGLDDAALQEIVDRFSDEMRLLIAKHGQAAIGTAIDAMPVERWPSIALH